MKITLNSVVDGGIQYIYGFSLFSNIRKEEIVLTKLMGLLKLEGELFSHLPFPVQKIIIVIKAKATQVINSNINHLVNTFLNLLYTYLLNK